MSLLIVPAPMESTSRPGWAESRSEYLCADGYTAVDLHHCVNPDGYAAGGSRILYPYCWGGSEQMVQALLSGVVFDR